MNYGDYEDFQKKFRTMHRDDMYHVIRENDRTGMFSGMVDIFLMAFGIGFHNDVREPVRGSGAINHVNASAISADNQDLIIVLMIDRYGQIEKDLLSVSSSRVGYVPGIHTVMVDGTADTIEITHTARSREGFAEGAVRAARWITMQPTGLYTMDDFLNDLIGGNRNA